MSNPGSGADQPNPFSREGAGASDPLGGDPNLTPPPASAPSPAVEPTSNEWPGYPPAGDPYAGPPTPATPRPPYVAPGFDPQPTPPYGGGTPAQPYGQAYGQPTPNPYEQPYEQPPADPYGQPEANPYGSNPYAVNPYQPTYGGYGSYGVAPIQHPQAVLAMVLGIAGLVLSGVCVGGLVGIAGIVLGRKARREIDAEPGRYTGRGMATAGLITGIISCVFSALILIGFTVTAVNS